MPALLALMQVCMAKKAPLGQQQEERRWIEV
jgi:hypothetical protein